MSYAYEAVDAAERERAILSLKVQVEGHVQRRDDLGHELRGIARELHEAAVCMLADTDIADYWVTWNVLAQFYRQFSENLNDQKRAIEGLACAYHELKEYGVTDV